jgi:hypothetical protein
MKDDPIVQEVRAIRDAYAAEFNYDLKALYENIKQLEKMSNKPHQRLLPKRIVTLSFDKKIK